MCVRVCVCVKELYMWKSCLGKRCVFVCVCARVVGDRVVCERVGYEKCLVRKRCVQRMCVCVRVCDRGV